MKNYKTKSLWAVIGLIGVFSLYSIATSYTGDAPEVLVEGDYIAASGSEEPSIGGVTFVREIFTEGIQKGEIGEQWTRMQVNSGDFTSSFTGGFQPSVEIGVSRTVYVDRVIIKRSGTASTTLEFDIATSTAETLAYNATPYASGIDSIQVTTSTASQIVLNNFENQGTNGTQIFAVQSDEFVNYLISDPYQPANCTGATCENATSTNRGYTADIYVHYTWLTGQ